MFYVYYCVYIIILKYFVTYTVDILYICIYFLIFTVLTLNFKETILLNVVSARVD